MRNISSGCCIGDSSSPRQCDPNSEIKCLIHNRVHYCLNKTYQCDGEVDCVFDGSDEKGCSKYIAITSTHSVVQYMYS